MKATVFVRSATALAIISLAGCSTWDSMSKTGQATTVGATSGAVGGAVVGGPVGAVAGAAIGGVAGHEMAKSDSTKPTTARSDTSSTYAANDATASRPTPEGTRSSSSDTGAYPSSPGATNSGAAASAGSSNDTRTTMAARGNSSTNPTATADPGKTTAMDDQSPATSSGKTGQRSLSREADIRAIQQSLNDQGYDAGNVDGIWGPKTAGAVRKFQADRGLQATGRLDAETRTALGVANGAVSSSSTPMNSSANPPPSQVSSAVQ